MGVTPLTFTGTSQYAADFQSILTRSVGIASIPLQALENQDTTVLNKKNQLGTLNSAVSALTSAVASLGIISANQAISGTSTNTAAVTIDSTSAKSPASYTINSVTSLATSASETSLTGYADSSNTPVSTTGILNLVVGSKQIPINLSSANNNLLGLKNAINQANAGVTASILTTGSGNFLSISANTLGATTLQLFNDPTGTNNNLLSNLNQGTNAVFSLNGIPVSRTQNTVNDLIGGLTFTLHAPTTTPLSLNLASDPTQLSNGIQTFVTAYNAVVDQINSQSGTGAGLLSGDTALLQTESALRQLTTYQGSGTIKSFSDLGLQLGSNGKIVFDPTVINGLSNTQLTSAFQFFGSATAGFGGLSQTLSQIADPISGAITSEQNTLTQQDKTLQTQIANTTARINSQQATLLQQLSQADTLISRLNTQQSALTASIQSLNYVLYGNQSQSSSSSSSSSSG